MPKVRYVGPLVGVDIPLVRLTDVKPGDEFDATEAQAALLLEQADNFHPADAPASRKKSTPAPAGDPAQEG